MSRKKPVTTITTFDISAQDRASNIHYARVILDEARRRRHQPAFHAMLLSWVANARHRAASCRERQGSLFI